jgi:hypothetical protein
LSYKPKEKPGMMFYHAWYSMLEQLPADDFKFLVLAALHYSETGESPAEIPQRIAPTYALLQAMADLDTARYEKTRGQNSDKGKKSAELRARQRELTTVSHSQPRSAIVNYGQPRSTESTNTVQYSTVHSIAPPPQASGRGAYGEAVGGAMLENEKTLDIYPNAPQATLMAGLQGIGEEGETNEQYPF